MYANYLVDFSDLKRMSVLLQHLLLVVTGGGAFVVIFDVIASMSSNGCMKSD